jgi:hypothetical protein
MPVICKHGLDESFCAVCQQAMETEPLRRGAQQAREIEPLRRDAQQARETEPLRRDARRARETEPLRRDARRVMIEEKSTLILSSPLRRDALRVTEEGKPALILRTILPSLSITALVLDGSTIHFKTIKEISLRHPMTIPSFKPREILKVLLDLALQKGYLFQPKQEITYQEQVGEGSPRCTFDHSELSLEKGSLGCTQCQTYLCRCGRCLCGYTGKNTLGQVISWPTLPVAREERLEYIRVVKFCEANIETRPKAKILLFTRDKKHKPL